MTPEPKKDATLTDVAHGIQKAKQVGVFSQDAMVAFVPELSSQKENQKEN